MEKKFLTATDLMNYSYCPRIIYYVHVLKRPQFTTSKEYKGREKESDFQEKLGIKTIVDSIMVDKEKNEAYPIQAKYSFKPSKLYRAQLFQIIMESMLIEECLGYKSPFGFIKFLRSGELVKVDTEKRRQEVLEAFQSIEKIMATESFPKPTKYRKRCVDCCFKSICW
ncbi:MAG: CRISPR-associated protein Cas4 [Candidatus Aenigmarchaeota archaeon]|nr:CRISPR-associated protein Cas4 [Candidatus Aenigmarchaeota archaeon]